MSYAGNKRNEVENIYKELNFDDITTIIEPYCGSCAMSYFIFLKHPNLKFVLNDNNKYLLEMFNIIKDNKKCEEFEKEFNKLVVSFKNSKEKYIEIINQNTLISWFIKNKIYNIRPGLFPLQNRTYKDTLKLSNFPIYNFFREANIEFYNEDAIEIYEKYNNDKNTIILLDPPYIMTGDNFYLNKDVNIYEYLIKNEMIKKEANIYFILEDVWIIKLLFNKYSFIEYDKKYEASKRTTKHIIISNKKLI
jgi:DNA adenine methylase